MKIKITYEGNIIEIEFPVTGCGTSSSDLPLKYASTTIKEIISHLKIDKNESKGL